MISSCIFPAAQEAGLAAAACELAEEVGAGGIVVVEPPLQDLLSPRLSQGALTRAVSQGGEARPMVPIISIASSLKVCRQLGISRGVYPVHASSAPRSPAEAAAEAVAAQLVPAGETLVVLSQGSLTTVTV